jgi:hypothetical protein
MSVLMDIASGIGGMAGNGQSNQDFVAGHIYLNQPVELEDVDRSLIA